MIKFAFKIKSLKSFSIILLAMLLLVPPVQAHADAIVFDTVSETHFNDLNEEHQEHHHQNDTEDEKDSEHHHHCTLAGFSSLYITPYFRYEFISIFTETSPIVSHKNLHTSNFLENLFQPPQV